jgi:S-adenosylmethionine/arginine decarboxylase-like enzyme
MIDPADGRKIYVAARQCNPRALADEGMMRDFLQEVTKAVGMTPMEPPTTYKVGPGEKYDTRNDFGVTGHIAWKESGAMLHTWPELGRLNLDCESCKQFNAGRLAELARDVSSSGRMRIYDLSYVLRDEERFDRSARLEKAAVAAYQRLQQEAPDCEEAKLLGLELFA